jgi:ubiquinone biosynthesis protein
MLAAQSSSVSGIVFTVAVLATSLALVAGLAWASRRLLGLPVGALRALIAGLLGFVVAYLLGRSLQAAQPGHAVAFFTVVLGVPLVVAMIFIVVAEALVPSGTGPGSVEAIRGVRSAIARSRRYWQISRIAVRHGLRPYLHGRRRDQKAGLPSPSWVSCCPPAVTCSRRSSFPNSPSSRTGPSRRRGSKWRR